jgi:hypothetical protein
MIFFLFLGFRVKRQRADTETTKDEEVENKDDTKTTNGLITHRPGRKERLKRAKLKHSKQENNQISSEVKNEESTIQKTIDITDTSAEKK